MTGQCRDCQRRKDAERYLRDRERLIAYQKNYQKANREKVQARKKTYEKNYPEMRLLVSARSRAKKSGVPFSITKADVVIPARCPLLGIKLMVRTDGKYGGAPYSPSLDQIVPKKGYVPGNVWVISWRANRLKGETMPEDLVKFALAILREFSSA